MLTTWYGLSSIILGIVLFFPLRKFMLALNVNKRRNKLKREITEEELEALKRKATIWAAIIAVTFAFLYNKFIMFKFFGGTGG